MSEQAIIENNSGTKGIAPDIVALFAMMALSNTPQLH